MLRLAGLCSNPRGDRDRFGDQARPEQFNRAAEQRSSEAAKQRSRPEQTRPIQATDEETELRSKEWVTVRYVAAQKDNQTDGWSVSVSMGKGQRV